MNTIKAAASRRANEETKSPNREKMARSPSMTPIRRQYYISMIQNARKLADPEVIVDREELWWLLEFWNDRRTPEARSR
jgi:hypothetical protein